MAHFALLLRPSFGFTLAHHVQADSWHEGATLPDGGDPDVVFVRDERVVYRVPARYVAEVVPCETHKEATERMRLHREALIGARALRVVEGHAAPRGRRGQAGVDVDGPQVPAAFAEGFTVRMKE